MSLSKAESLLPPEDRYIPFPSEHDQVYTVLPIHDPPTNRRSRRWPKISVLATLSLFLLGGFVYLFWPSDPTLQIVRLRLEKIRIHTVPIIHLDISMHVTIKVQNVDVYSLDLTNLDVAVKYRGKKLGHVQSDHGHVRAFGSSYVDAELNLSGVRVLADVVPLLDDLAKGSLPLDTVSEVSGRLGLLFFGFPLKAKLSCEVLVNTKNQTIVRQSCFPEVKTNAPFAVTSLSKMLMYPFCSQGLSSDDSLQSAIISLENLVDG